MLPGSWGFSGRFFLLAVFLSTSEPLLISHSVMGVDYGTSLTFVRAGLH